MKKINVCFDGRVLKNGLAENGGRTGIYFVARNLFLEFSRRNEDFNLSVFLEKKDLNLLEQLKQDLDGAADNCAIYTQDSDFSDVEAFFSPVFKVPDVISQYPQISCYTVLYDIIALLFPQYFNQNLFTSWYFPLIESLNDNDNYFSISEYTKKDFLRHFPKVKADNITTMLIATNQPYKPNKNLSSELRAKYNIPADKKYLFSLCSLEPRKNLICAVKTFIKFIEKNEINDLVFVLGGSAWQGFIEKLETEVPDLKKYQDKIVRAGYVADEDLEVLYSNAEWFVYTSQYEGFGMPPLEAMACGTAIITSNNSSLPEVVGDAAIMIDFDSEEQHIAAYEKYYFDDKYRREMALKGLERSKQFSWAKAVDIILNKMREIEAKKARQPMVTIITPSFNLIKGGREKTFVQNIESVQKQTYKNIEHIVIDGASKDGTLEILEKYRQKGMIKYYSEPDKGIYDAMNKGILKANGKYVVCLNSDDCYCNEKAIEWLVSKAEETDADVAYGNTLRVSAKDETVKEVWNGKQTFYPLFGSMPCHQSIMVKTDVMKELGLYDLRYRVSSDNNFMVKMVQHNKKFVHVNANIVVFHDGGFSDSHLGLSEDERIQGFYKEYGQYHNLTTMDCFNLFGYRYLQLPSDEAILLGCKIDNPDWQNEYFKKLTANQGTVRGNDASQVCGGEMQAQSFGVGEKTYKLFNFIPLLKVKRQDFKIKYSLFGLIPLYKHKRKDKTRSWKFFGISTLKIKQKVDQSEKIYLFGMPIMTRERIKLKQYGSKKPFLSYIYDKTDNEKITQICIFGLPVYRHIKAAMSPQKYMFNEEPADFTIENFYNKEDWGRWCKKEGCSISFFNCDAKAAEFDVQTFLHDNHRNLTVKVYVNGSPAAVWNFEKDKANPSLIVPLYKFMTNDIVFETINPISPAELDMGNDSRALGLGVKSMRLITPQASKYATQKGFCWEYVNNEYICQLQICGLPVYRKIKKKIPDNPVYEFNKENPELKLKGFSGIEPWGRWSNGEECSISFFNYDVKKVQVDVQAFVNEKHPSLIVKVYLNGRKQGRWEFVKGKVAPSIYIALRRFAQNNITFKIANPISPKELGLGDDARSLGIRLLRMKSEVPVRVFKKYDLIEFQNKDIQKKGMSDPGKYMKVNYIESSVCFCVKPDDYIIKLHMGGYGGTQSASSVDFIINDELVKTVDFRNNTLAIVEIPVRHEQIAKNQGKVNLVFQSNYDSQKKLKGGFLEDNGISFRALELCPYKKSSKDIKLCTSPVIIGGSAFNRSGGGAVWDYLYEFNNVLLEKGEIHFIRHMELLLKNISRDKKTQHAAITSFIQRINNFRDAKVFPHLQSRLYARDVFILEFNNLINQVIANPVDPKLLDKDYRFPVDDVKYEFNAKMTSDKLLKLIVKTVRKVLLEETKYDTIGHFSLFSGCSSTLKNAILGGNIKEISVYRDPRDQYVELVHYGMTTSFEDYSKRWFPMLKELKELKSNPNVLLVRFEEFVLNYEEFTKKVREFCGLDEANHVYNRFFFEPEQSRRNIGIWKNFADQETLRKIEKELPELLWNE